jgi:hypothetical protein
VRRTFAIRAGRSPAGTTCRWSKRIPTALCMRWNPGKFWFKPTD